MRNLSGRVEMGGTLKKEDRARKQGSGGYFSFAAAFLLMGGVLFGVLNFRTHLIEEAERLNAEAARLQTRIEKLDREIAYQRIRCEELKSRSYIQGKTAARGLRDALPSQIRQIVLLRRTEGPKGLETVARPVNRTVSK